MYVILINEMSFTFTHLGLVNGKIPISCGMQYVSRLLWKRLKYSVTEKSLSISSNLDFFSFTVKKETFCKAKGSLLHL